MIEQITSQAIACSFPIIPNFSTVFFPFKFIKFLFIESKFDNDIIILFLIFDTFGFSQIKFISILFIEKLLLS